MSGDKKIETSELIAPGTMSDSTIKLPEEDIGTEVIPSEPISSVSAAGNAMSGIKEAIDQTPAIEQGVYDYYYPGYNGTFAQSEDKGFFNTAGGSYTGMQSDNASHLYYLPSYSPYTTGFVGVDGKQVYASSDYLQQPCSYGSEAFPCYTYDSTYTGNGLTGTAARSGSVSSVMGPSGSGKSNGYNTAKTNNSLSSKTSALPFGSRIQQPVSNFSKSIYQNQPHNPQNKLGSGFRSSGTMKEFHPAGKFSSFTTQNRGVFMQYGPVNYQSNNRVWNNNYRYKSRENFGRSRESEAVTELTRGPRADNRSNSLKLPAEGEQLAFAIERDKYNLQEFQTEYDNAKFYVIKSYSEDDIHKCIKYDVWSSTPNGNKKLDAAFREADKISETGTKSPIFLFFSVNGSGQFVGVAEMIGQVDFSKNMDFWQLDKWNGFFPIKWHIIKDVPNTLLRHIILENNENRAVTYSRDTQEIGLKQGLEMLSIFKSYSAKTSVLDDFNFYENREKALKAKRNARPASQTSGFRKADYEKHLEVGEGIIRDQPAKNNQSDPSSLISQTRNLSLNSQPPKNSL